MEIEKITDRFNSVAQEYDEQRRYFIPCYDDYYQLGVSFISKIRTDFRSVLDLGAGTGLLTKYLLEKFPGADYTLIDASEQMLGLAAKRFEHLDNITYLVSDYAKNIPRKQFDLITSALSIHHLDEEAKAELYSKIFDCLPDGGFFLNLDQFNAGSALVNEYYNQYWYTQIKESGIRENERNSWLQRRELDKENTISESIQLLIQSGFSHVECVYSYMKFGVILAIR